IVSRGGVSRSPGNTNRGRSPRGGRVVLGSLFRLLSKTPRPPRGLLPRFVLPGERDTPPRETMFHPHDCDATADAYSCRALAQCARIPKRGGTQGCRTCIGVRDQFRK